MTKRLALASLLATLALAGCSRAELDTALQKGEKFVAERAAVTAAETLRVTLIEKAEAAGVSPEDVAFILKVSSSLPGVQLAIADADGNGIDDDGRVTVSVMGAAACLQLPNLSQKGAASAGAC
jgi:hypothetical protein